MDIKRAREAARKCGFSVPTLWRKTKLDPTFPQPIKVSENVTGWIEAELDAWLGQRVAASRPAVAATQREARPA